MFNTKQLLEKLLAEDKMDMFKPHSEEEYGKNLFQELDKVDNWDVMDFIGQIDEDDISEDLKKKIVQKVLAKIDFKHMDIAELQGLVFDSILHPDAPVNDDYLVEKAEDILKNYIDDREKLKKIYLENLRIQ